MGEPTRVAEFTLEQFCRAAASAHPTPAGVSVAATSAAFALGLLAKVLAVSGRKALPEHHPRLESLAAAARAASEHLLQLAADDAAAFEGYLAAKRLPHTTQEEDEQRLRAIDSAVDQAIAVPLAAAQKAADGVELCGEASHLTPPSLIADLGVAATLLSSALQAFLLCAQSNVKQLAPDATSHRERLVAQTSRHERALREAEMLLERTRTTLETAQERPTTSPVSGSRSTS